MSVPRKKSVERAIWRRIITSTNEIDDDNELVLH
jgi:hypothetical protein